MERVLWIGRRLEMGRREERNRIVLGEGWRSLLIRDEGGNVVDAAAERRREEQEESDGDDGMRDTDHKGTEKAAVALKTPQGQDSETDCDMMQTQRTTR
ncbi:hypothetical protein DID88_008108 [Monilinia fructigena]|uniref:Uncharacterized protein n=1 Tax=Monilinia fructigena TaxID=38457 RepID=A0A395J4S6_9HELO|nr:hypothetical protein DID88_008108 [Monilinia fructigena]